MKKISILLAILMCTISSVWAGFPLGKGRIKIIPAYNYYVANGYWDKQSNYLPYANGGRFVSHYFNVSGGIGLSRDLDFLANIPFVGQIDNDKAANKISSNWGLGDATVGLSYYLSHFDDSKHLSVTGSFIIPLYQNSIAPFIGFQKVGGELKLGFAGSTNSWYRNPYYDLEIGVRQFFDQYGPTQVFTNITGGIPLSETFKISGTISGLNSVSADPAINFNQNNLFANKQFNFVRITANAGYTINGNVAIWGNIFRDVYGTNTGKGSGFSIFAVYKF